MAVKAAELAIKSIGLGFDIAADLRLKYCKRGSADPCLIKLDDDHVRDVVLPGGVLIPNVSTSIKCDKGERMRFTSDVLSFQQMSEQINKELSLSGKIPSGLFNAMFDFSGCWQKDAANTKSLAYDGCFITLYTVAVAKSQIVLRDHVKSAVPSSWDPYALASFIQRYGTHIMVGVKMGGKDVVHVKQQHPSNVQPADVQRRLKEMADKRFLDATAQCGADSDEAYVKDKSDAREIRLRFAASSPLRSYPSKDDIICTNNRKGGSKDKNLSHYEWLDTIQSEPDVIWMTFIPITSLLSGVLGSGFLSHAINLYLRYKPPTEELHQFLEFQLPRQWAPVFGELPLGLQHKQRSRASLKLGLLGPRLYINTMPIDVGKRPVTGLRLYLEGKKSNRLAIHLQHLSALPKSFQLYDDPGGNLPCQPDVKFFEPVQRRRFCHVCTAPIESYDELAIVTGAQLRVTSYGCKRVLILHLHFSRASNAVVVKQPQWAGTPGQTQKSGIMSMLISGHFTTAQKPPPVPDEVIINSAVFPGGPPGPAQAPKLLKFVNTTEMCRGPEHNPGYWVVSGAKLSVEKGKISLKVKYSLLTALLPDDEMMGESI